MLTFAQPKAGQGMNTAFHDALNLAWKLHLVDCGFARRSILETYESERKMIAEDLLSFDAKYATLFSQRPPSANEVDGASDDHNGEDSNEFYRIFKSGQEFTSGYGVAYKANVLNWTLEHPASSPLFNPEGNKARIGRVMPTADVTRVVDANKAKLEHEIPLNGSFRILLFAGRPTVTKQAIDDFAFNIQRKPSFYSTYERKDRASVSYHERHNPHSHFFSICIIFATARAELDVVSVLHPLLARYSDHVYADDIRDSTQPDAKAAAHAKMGLDEERGGVIIVRPDGHVACVVSLVEGSGTVDALNEYFGAFVTKPLGRPSLQARL